jgi:hypothetical protein
VLASTSCSSRRSSAITSCPTIAVPENMNAVTNIVAEIAWSIGGGPSADSRGTSGAKGSQPAHSDQTTMSYAAELAVARAMVTARPPTRAFATHAKK